VLARALPAVVAASVLLVLVAIASHGRPLSVHHAGEGPNAGFFDYFFTTALLLFAAGLVLLVYLVAQIRASGANPGRERSALGTVAFVLIVAVALLAARQLHLTQRPHSNGSGAGVANGQSRQHVATAGHGRDPRVRWDEIAIVAALLVAAGGAAFAMRSRGPLPALRRRTAAEELSAVIDDTLDDLRREQDVRRAIIAAYARMEATLAARGLPRHRAEAPLEYLERTLLHLDASAASVRHLTDLFEWAKFSHHEPDPGMKDEAIDALETLRDELRAAAEPEAA
jgi:hypothetical protein